MKIEPLVRPPDAVVRVPGSKSLTNRALVCALLADGTSTITGALDSNDTRAMADAIEKLGAHVQWDGSTITVVGTAGKLQPGQIDLNVGQAGTAARFLSPVLALGLGRYRLDGDEQLRRRPMGPMIEALRSLGVEVREEDVAGHLPITVTGRWGIPGQRVRVPADVSSQFISGLMMVQPYAGPAFEVVPTTELVSAPYIRMTRTVMNAFGPGRYHGTAYTVEADATAASYFFAAAALFDEATVTVQGLGAGTQQGDIEFVAHLQAMGAVAAFDLDWVQVGGARSLRGLGEVDMRDCPDVAQTLAVVAAFAEGATTVTNIGFVRYHETDRIKAVVTELKRCGIEAEEHDDGFTVPGATPDGGTPHGATVRTYGDHRMAMSFAVLGLKVDGIEIDDPGCVAKTFPDFFDVLEGLRR